MLALGGCARTVNPEPSVLFDGRYAGTRESNLPEACGIAAASGRTSADIARGRLRIQLFNPGTTLTGTVGEDGSIRASGLWSGAHSFPNFTIFHGRVADGRLNGTASDSRCETEIALKRVGRR